MIETELTDHIIDLYRGGLTPTQIANRDEVPWKQQGVYERLRKAGELVPYRNIQRRYGRIPEIAKEEGQKRAFNLAYQGKSIRQIAADLNFSYGTVQQWLSEPSKSG